MNDKYPIDATIISILFNIRSEEAAEKAYLDFKELQERFFDKSLVDYLESKGFTEDQLTEFFQADNPADFPEISKQYKTHEFFEYADIKVNEFNKRVYDERLPLLKDENKRALSAYLDELDKAITEDMTAISKVLSQPPATSMQVNNNVVETGLPPIQDQKAVNQSEPMSSPVPTEPQTPPQPVENP